VRAFAAIFLTGCSVLTDFGALQSSDAGLDASMDSTASMDAGVDTADAPVVDAPKTDGESGTLGFCASLVVAPKFCEDFDTGLFSTQFTKVHESNSGGMVSASMGAFQSPPTSLRCSLPANDAGASDYAYMTRLFLGTASSVTYGFDFRVDAWTTGGRSGVGAAVVIDDGTPNQHTLSFYVTDTYAAVEEIFTKNNVQQFVDHTLAMHPLLNQWVRVTIGVDLANRTATVKFGGTDVLGPTALDVSWTTGTPAIDLGLSYSSGQASPWIFRYDNVTVDWK